MFSALARGVTRAVVVPVGANGQRACAFYRGTRDAPPTLRAIQLLEAKDGAISMIDHFQLPEVFPFFCLPKAATR
ncbi:hypothetical protein BH09MYX1_BH09MYX1_60610 [soil metagenome]